jgi:hypothetical protein
MPPTLTPMTVRGGQPITTGDRSAWFLQIAFLEKQLILVFSTNPKSWVFRNQVLYIHGFFRSAKQDIIRLAGFPGL